jgi:hypothetical protein
VDAILNLTSYTHFELLILDNQSTCSQTLAYMHDVAKQDPRVRVLRWDAPFNHESVSRGPNDTRAKRAVADAEAQFMRQKWGKLLDTDPCYNPNLTLVHEDFSLG